MKNILIVSSSPRENSNSDLLCQAFYKGALESGGDVHYISLKDSQIEYCCACDKCRTEGKCIYKDDMEIYKQRLLAADVIVLATPVYFYSMSAQLKTFIDRLYPIYTDIKADIYIFVSGYDDNKIRLEQAIEAIRGCTRDCFENCEEKGIIVASNCKSNGDVKGSDVELQAYYMGRNC